MPLVAAKKERLFCRGMRVRLASPQCRFQVLGAFAPTRLGFASLSNRGMSL